jgi:hypothetical protein
MARRAGPATLWRQARLRRLAVSLQEGWPPDPYLAVPALLPGMAPSELLNKSCPYLRRRLT